ncbi:MAG: IPExxxVDY family protein [Flavobacteriales bacterium]|nr:IPExxxVDY family protein [Flavobacteriales bacterium]MBP6641499.1 IPExxxVDY family protein [Flavobacteriales bacterium]MBP7154738.1 IPExxxVDY family protein [Flavobacteriales bacterium]HQV73962.1 IPExxxVDY family protein [Flavobacteriales bacterium]HQW39631.1 IPExxxVDY family protein [Flavobacteriales bacterium]
MAKLKLDMDPDPEITVLGISSHVNDYRLCWAVNKALDLSLTRRRKNIEEEIDGVLASYSAYDHVDPETQARYTLINNHSGDGILLREQRQADYFLVVDNELAEQYPDLVGRVRKAELVLTAFEIPFDDLREGHKLLL